MTSSGVDVTDLAKVVDRNGNGTVEVNEATEFLATLRAKGVKSPRLQEQVLVVQPFHNYTDEVKHGGYHMRLPNHVVVI